MFSYGITILNLKKKRFFLGQVIYKQLKKAMLHMPTLEVVWTLLPVIALISIALPSLSMCIIFHYLYPAFNFTSYRPSMVLVI